MRYNILGKTGMKVSALSCGTNLLSRSNQEQASIVLNYAIEQGINLIETGSKNTYGVVEEMVGHAVADQRDKIWLCTKTISLNAGEVMREVDQSLKSLMTDRIDLYQLGNIRFQHQLDRVLSPGGALQGLIRAQRQGKINYIGITGHCPDMLMKALRAYPFDNVQFILNMIHPYPLDELLNCAKENGIGTCTMRPTGHGALAPASKSLRFALCSGADVVLSGMYSVGIVNENIQTAEPEPTKDEWKKLFEEMMQVQSTGCRECSACLPCPQGIAIQTLMTLLNYRQKYGLLPPEEAAFKKQIIKAKDCNDCGECEKRCPYGLRIIPVIHEAAMSQ